MSEVSSQQHLDKPKQGDVRGEKHGEEDVKLKKKNQVRSKTEKSSCRCLLNCKCQAHYGM